MSAFSHFKGQRMCLFVFAEKKFFSTDRRKRKKSCLLLQFVLDCLYKTFLYDTEGFVNKERFDMIMQPLVDQVRLETSQRAELLLT